MALYVKVIDGTVTQVWDTTPPEGEQGWREAVEVRAPLQQGRQAYTAHRYDLTTTPVQIIWDTYEITVDQRKNDMKLNADFPYIRMQREMEMNPQSHTAEELETARTTAETKKAAIDAATTHDQLDALS